MLGLYTNNKGCFIELKWKINSSHCTAVNMTDVYAVLLSDSLTKIAGVPGQVIGRRVVERIIYNALRANRIYRWNKVRVLV